VSTLPSVSGSEHSGVNSISSATACAAGYIGADVARDPRRKELPIRLAAATVIEQHAVRRG